ncbi:MAG: 5,5'-dehydrodivanillate O-demethylase [Chloroflexi bacterium]|jgi:5,5'-dehydrodivanillate O-demethylase|nr:MAG: 5,5'-dehydrodivanillate O-demethylase [Chloroflexota bacterium]
MLSVQENERLTQVGPGTPMGELLRRYWYPIAPAAELDENPTKEVRILGEDLVLYKDRSGDYGLVGRYCAHRRVNLAYGIPEEHGLRCMYHGWLYDEAGQCTEQPFEETVRPQSRFKDKIKLPGYPVQAQSGLLFAYLGPEPAPYLPKWGPLVWGNTIKEISITEIPCNWLQCMENSLDPIHVEWLHRYYTSYVWMRQGKIADTQPPKIRHRKIGFDVFDHGIIKRRVLDGYTEDDDDWKIGHPVLFPHILYVQAGGVFSTLQHRVPIDDEHTLHVTYYAYESAPGTEAPAQDSVPYRYANLYKEDGTFEVDFSLDQDKMVWASQGPIAERNHEALGDSDTGIILLRKLLNEQMRIVEDGGDPINVFRDEEAAQSMQVPVERIGNGWDKLKEVRYIPLEQGETPALEEIMQVLSTWGDRSKVLER